MIGLDVAENLLHFAHFIVLSASYFHQVTIFGPALRHVVLMIKMSTQENKWIY